MTIAFFGTGGTISNRGTGADNYLDYLDEGEVMDATTLLAQHPGLDQLATIRVMPFEAMRSKFMTHHHWAILAQGIQEQLDRPEITAAVVTHGTGTLEETAWYLHLVLDSTKPVVVVGAQRPGSTTASDTRLNLSDALRVAVDPASSGRGVTVVMHREIHSARDVTKLANHRLAALQSPVRGPLGVIHADHRVDYWRHPTTPHTSHSAFAKAPHTLPRVDLVHTYTDADDTALEAFLAAGARGLIAVGYPPGTLTAALDAGVDRAIAAGIPVVQATRALSEPAVMPRAGLLPRGLIPNTDIVPTKAKILLQLCLAHDMGHDEIRQIFARY